MKYLNRGYELLGRLPRDYLAFALLPFDTSSAAIYNQLLGQNLRVGTMDLRLAAIALSHNLTVFDAQPWRFRPRAWSHDRG